MQEAAAQARTAARIANIAVRAAVHEAAATRKPGLVCADSRGAHDDMDFATLLAGALSLRPYFTDAAALGFRTAHAEAKDAFPQLRNLGRTAEAAMYKATGGVNTHKGLIFSLGLFCAAAGRTACQTAGRTNDKANDLTARQPDSWPDSQPDSWPANQADSRPDRQTAKQPDSQPMNQTTAWDAALLSATAGSYLPGLCGNDFAPLRDGAAVSRVKAFAADPGVNHAALWEHARAELAPLLGRTPSAGEILYVCFDETGVRGEAEAGFPHVPPACEALRAWLETEDFNDALINTLLLLMRDVRDTNILRRGGREGLSLVMRSAREALDLGGMREQKGRDAVAALADACAQKRLSPGGSADLLCLALFVILGERDAAAR